MKQKKRESLAKITISFVLALSVFASIGMVKVNAQQNVNHLSEKEESVNISLESMGSTEENRETDVTYLMEEPKEEFNQPDAYTPATVSFSEEAGAYTEAEKILILSAPEGYSIYYTCDGSVPTAEAALYTDPITLTSEGNRWLTKETSEQMTARYNDKTIGRVKPSDKLPGASIIRAIAVAPDGTTGEVTTKTYFLKSDLQSDFNNCMIISVVTDPDNLLDYNTGILATGTHYDEWIQTEEGKSVMKHGETWKTVGNFSQTGDAWKRPASLEFFDDSNVLTLQQNGAIQVAGCASRRNAQKSFNLYSGDTPIAYPMLPDAVNDRTQQVIEQYSTLAPRNGGNDTDYLKFKDAWLQSRISDREFSTQRSRLAVIFLNGEYWGHYSLLEKYGAEYFDNHYDVKDILFINEGTLHNGTEEDYKLYEQLLAFQEKDLSVKENWDAFKQTMDIQSMADYFAAEIYIGQADWWQTKNIGLWRSTTVQPENPFADGKWRYIMYDTEYSSGLYDQEKTKVNYNTMQLALDNHPLFAAAMQNPEFQTLFRDTIEEIAQNNFKPGEVEQDLKKWADQWKPFMKKYYTRFGDSSWAWETYMKSTVSYFNNRYKNIMGHIDEVLSLNSIEDEPVPQAPFIL